jgi:hypothetical protein
MVNIEIGPCQSKGLYISPKSFWKMKVAATKMNSGKICLNSSYKRLLKITNNSYWKPPSLRKCIRKVIAIGYLHLLLVRQNFNIHRNANSTRRLVRRFPALNDFLNIGF